MPRSRSSRNGDDACSVLSAERALDKVDQVSSRLEAVRSQTLRSIQAAEDATSSARDERMYGRESKQPHVGEEEIADLVGQLERYAENKSHQGKFGAGVGGYDDVKTPSQNKLSSKGIFPYHEGDKWGATNTNNRGKNLGGSDTRGTRYGGGGGGGGGGKSSRLQDDDQSLVGAWDVGSSKYASSVPDSDVQSVYSEFTVADERFLPTGDRYSRVDSRMDSVSQSCGTHAARYRRSENLLQHRRRLEETLNKIDVAEDDNTMAFMHGDGGMPTAGKTRTGVAVIDLFAKEQDRKKNGGANSKGQQKWLKRETTKDARGKVEVEPAQLSPFMSFLEGVFGCCSVRH